MVFAEDVHGLTLSGSSSARGRLHPVGFAVTSATECFRERNPFRLIKGHTQVRLMRRHSISIYVFKKVYVLNLNDVKDRYAMVTPFLSTRQ